MRIYFLFPVILLAGFAIIAGYYYVRDLMFESNRYRLQYEVREILDDVENSMDDASTFAKHLAIDFNRNSIKSDSAKMMAMVFDGQPNTYSFGMVTSRTSNPSLQKSSFTLFRSGDIIQSDTGRYVSRNGKVNEWINKMLVQSKPEWSAPFFNKEIGSRAMIYAYPFDYLNYGASVHATFFCLVDLDENLRKLNNLKMIKSGFAVLLSEKNQIIYHPDSLETGQSTNSLIRYFDQSQFDVNKSLAERSTGYQLIHSKSLKSKSMVVIYWPAKSTNWYMIMAIPENLFMSELKRLSLIFIPIILFIVSVAAAVAIYNSIKLISPISFLANDSRKILEESGFEKEINLNDPKILSDSPTIWRLSSTHPKSTLTDLQALSENMDKIKDQLADYRESTIQNSKDKKEIENELKLARDIEMAMVPTNFPLVPDRNDFDCYGKLIPAKIVGGDLFDLFLLGDDQLFISITDTLGKGIPAAMFSVMTRTFIRSIANPITRLGKMMESLNDALHQIHETDMFATVLLFKLNLKTGELIYCNAGHPHPIILRNNSREEILNHSHGIPLGVKRNLSFSENRIVLAPGESLITFTDGVTEQTDEHGEFFGIDRLVSVVHPMQKHTTQRIVNQTLDKLKEFKGKADVHDDITLVAIRFHGSDKLESNRES